MVEVNPLPPPDKSRPPRWMPRPPPSGHLDHIGVDGGAGGPNFDEDAGADGAIGYHQVDPGGAAGLP